MAQNETWLKHDLMKAVRVQYLDGNLFSMDNAGNLIGVTLTRDGEAYSGGGSVSANVIRADGGTVAVTGALSGNTATVVLPQAAYVVPGAVSIVVKLTASGQVTTIAAIVANVYRSSTDTAIDPGTIIPSVQALIAAIDTAVASIPADYSSLWAALAPAFSTSSAYTAGQYVTYNGGLYRFTTDHAAGTWSSSQVVPSNIGGELSDLKSALNELNEVTRNIWINPIYNANGIIITQNEDGSAHLSGTASTTLYIDYYLDEDLTLTSCTFSMKRTGTVGNKINAVIRNAGNTTPQFLPLETADTFASMRVINYSAHRFEIVVREGTYNCDLYIQLENGNSVTDYIPHISAKDYICREEYKSTRFFYGTTRNIWLNPIFRSGEIEATQNTDGSIHIAGTPTADTYLDAYYSSALSSDNYILSCEKKGTATGNISIVIRNAGNTNPNILTINSGTQFGTLQISSYAPARCEIVLRANNSYNCDLYIQLEKGNVCTDFIPNFTAVDYIAREKPDDTNLLTETVKNYVPIVIISEKSIITKWGNSAGVITHNGDEIGYAISVAKSGGFMTEAFLVSDMPSTDFRVTFGITLTNGTARVFLYGKKSNNEDVAYLIKTVSSSNDSVSVDVDAAYLDVYTTVDISKPMRVLIASGGDEISEFTVTGLEVNSNIVVSEYIQNYGQDTVANVLKRIENDNGTSEQEQGIQYYYSPNGTKYLSAVSNDGTIRGIKAIPAKSIFIGNSLLMGWSTFGMAASDSDHDYYHYVTQKISELNPSATYNHISNGNLEHSTNNTDFTAAWAVITPYLTSDVELICIQLGDNVNTDEKKAQFEGTSFNTMVDWIHTNCPNARLVWVGTWYQSIYDWLKVACWKKGVQFIDIFDLSVNENKAAIGDVIHRTEDRTQTLTGTYTISGSSLLLSATISGESYSITIPSYTSVEDNGNGTFTMVAPYTVVDTVGIASHPNDAGMLAIANRICKQLDFIYHEGDITNA